MKTITLFFVAIVMAFTLAGGVQARHTFLKSKGQEIRYREANAYSHQAEKRDITIGVEFLSKAEQKRLLGNNNGKFAALEVAISNNSRFRLYVNKIDFIGDDGTTAIYSASLDDIAKATGPTGKGNKKGMQMSILRNNLTDKNLQSKVILPGETIQGLVYVRGKRQVQGYALRMDLQNLKRLVYLDIMVPLDQ